MRTSDFLVCGEIYTRDQLRKEFAITDSTLNTGIFKPQGHDSIWLFITEKKSGDMTEYEDRLEGDNLYWQGQTAGLKDRQIIEHRERDFELVVFYRPEKSSYEGSGFRFEGPFEYVSHSGAAPTNFVLRRESGRPVNPENQESSVTNVQVDNQYEPIEEPAAGSLIQRLIELRQSGSGAVVSAAGLTELQELMHIPDAIEDWILARVERWRESDSKRPLLLMLSGNAGDGKSNLIERLVPRIGSSDDIAVIPDATHADRPTDDQTAMLAEFFSPFADGASADPRISLIAMNTGMALSFFSSVSDDRFEVTYRTLEQVVKRELGLAVTDVEPAWDYEIMNLDLRSMLPYSGRALFNGMLEKLEIANPEGILYEPAKKCGSCCVRQACFVHTNVQALGVPQIRDNLVSRLWSASLSNGVHLSPRNMWDFLYQVTTGGAEFFADVNDPCEKISELDSLGVEAMEIISRRLIYNLVFEPPEPNAARGPVFGGLADADPIRRVGRNSHAAESATFNDPAADADEMASRARELAIAASGDESTPPDPCLDNLAIMLKETDFFEESLRALIARGTLRRAALFGSPGITEELTDDELSDYLRLLDSYRAWTVEGDVPEEIYDYKSLLEETIGSIFGARDASGETYFRQDSFSPSTRYAVYAGVDLGEAINPVIDPTILRAPGWLDAVNYRPQSITVRISTPDHQSHVRGDLALYRLLRRVKEGYAASSVDLEAFFGLRFACERLGGTYSSATELLLKDLESGTVYRLREKTQMAKRKLELLKEPEIV